MLALQPNYTHWGISGVCTHRCQPPKSRNDIAVTHESKISFWTWNHLPVTRLHETWVQPPALTCRRSPRGCSDFMEPPRKPDIHHLNLSWRQEWHNTNLIMRKTQGKFQKAHSLKIPAQSSWELSRSSDTRNSWEISQSKKLKESRLLKAMWNIGWRPGQKTPVEVKNLWAQ